VIFAPTIPPELKYRDTGLETGQTGHLDVAAVGTFLNFENDYQGCQTELEFEYFFRVLNI